MKRLLLLTAFVIVSIMAYSQNAWINEIHYDNPSTDVDEIIEVVIENASSYTLSDFSISLYNGTDGETYSTITLDQYIFGEIIDGFSIYYYNYTSNGFSIQNGDPDGLALAYQGTLIDGQFLSYEGVFTATNGPAAGETSSDIGVAEPGNAGESLQLTGNGIIFGNFTWADPAGATPGMANNAQTFGTIAPDPEPDNHVTGFNVAEITWYSLSLQWNDAAGTNLPSGYLVKFSTTSASDIIAPMDGTAEADNDSVQNIAHGTETTTFYTLESSKYHYFKIWPYSNSGVDIDYKLDGAVPEAEGSTLEEPEFINHETFESGDFGSWTTWSAASDKDWTVTNALQGAIGTDWSAQINGYQENELSNDWLISPLLELSYYENNKLCFYTQWKYGSSMDELSLKYSADYSGGDPTSATWTEIPFTKPSTSEIWQFSDTINLTAITNSDVHLAFHYLSSGAPRRWNVDEIQILGSEIQEIDVLSPETGDEWLTGYAYDITWTSGLSTDVVDILYSLDASAPSPVWIILAEDVPAENGAYTWNIPEDQPTSADYQIKIEDQDNPITGYSGVFTVANPPYTPAIVINEIMYNPPESIGADEYFEFIELYNNDPETVNLLGFSLTGNIQYTFSSEILLQPGEYLVIASDPDSVSQYYGITAVEGPYTGLLLNTSDGMIELHNSDGFLVDEVDYGVTAPWPETPNGTGPSMELLAPSLDNTNPDNWEGSYTLGGTPGEINSIITEVEGIVISEIFYNPPGENHENIEFIEVYNSNAEAVNLGGCHFTKGIDFIFPAVTLGSGDYLVITKDLNTFISVFGLPAYEWQGGDLSNSADTLEIQDILGNIIDYVPYSSELPWDTIAAGHGPSLELLAPNINNEIPENWFASETFNTVLNSADTVWCSPYDGFLNDPPVAAFEASQTTIYVSEAVTFTSTSTGYPDFFAWSFPGGSPDTSNEEVPHITYHIPGTYDVSLYVSGIFGEDTEVKTDFITVLPLPDPPIADFEADNTIIFVGETVNFTDLSQNNPTAWEWYFMNGSPESSTVQNPQNILYEQPGKFEVVLQARNVAGEDVMVKDKYITVLDTTAYNMIITEIMYNPPETDTDSLEFIEIYNAGNEPVKLEGYYFYGIDFVFPEFEFLPGDFLIIASDAEAMMNTFGVNAFAFDGGFLDNNGELIEFYTPNGTLIDQVEYDDMEPWPEQADGNGPSLVLCDLQLDNSLPESWSASVDFAAVNSNNDTIWASPGASCGNVPVPVAAFTADPLSGTPGLIVAFEDLSANNPESWVWDFPGGNPESSTLQNPIVQYSEAGDFDVSLTVQNHWGSDSHTETAYIHISVGMNENDYNTVIVAPNPSHSGYFKIILNKEESCEYTVRSAAGAIVAKNTFNQKQHILDLSHLNDGIYILTIQNNKEIINNIKLIKN